MLGGETAYWLAISRLPGVGARRARRLWEALGSGPAVWEASAADLAAVLDMTAEKVAPIIEARAKLNPDKLLERVEKAGAWVLAFTDPEYPEQLWQLFDPPCVIYGWGEPLAFDRPRLAVVGARRMTAYGRQCVDRLISGIQESNAVIVSGLARGVDGAAHRAALENGLTTWAVLGSGFAQIYPGEHRSLVQQILAAGGTLLTEYWPDAPPDAHHFPARNRIIAALSQAVLVIEADEKSGSLITVDHALDLGRDVWAVPGNITSRFSRGTNRLLKQGAGVITTAEDILAAWGFNGDGGAVEQLHLPQLTPVEAQLHGLLTEQPTPIEELLAAVGLDTPEVLAALVSLEVKGLVQSYPGQTYALR